MMLDQPTNAKHLNRLWDARDVMMQHDDTRDTRNVCVWRVWDSRGQVHQMHPGRNKNKELYDLLEQLSLFDAEAQCHKRKPAQLHLNSIQAREQKQGNTDQPLP